MAPSSGCPAVTRNLEYDKVVWLSINTAKRCCKLNVRKISKMARSLSVKTLPLLTPPLEEVTKVLQDGLKDAFAESSVRVVDCPNLKKAPFNLAMEGICGKPRIADIGGEKHLMPLPKKDKIYNLDSIAELIGLPGALMIGAGAGPHHLVGVNCEFMVNVQTKSRDGEGFNNSYISKLGSKSGEYELFQLPENRETAILTNVLACEGKPGKVLEVKASRRTQKTNFITCMRQALIRKYGTLPVGLGGVFLIQRGKARIHIMPDFSTTPIEPAAVESWLQFFNMDAPLVCLSVSVTHDPGMNLRVEHTHCFSDHGQGGHYHEDTTPDEVEYLGYFVLPETLYRVDQPQ